MNARSGVSRLAPQYEEDEEEGEGEGYGYDGEEGEGEYEEEDDDDEDYYSDRRQAMREKAQQWNVLLQGGGDSNNDADETCLQLLQSMSSKMVTGKR